MCDWCHLCVTAAVLFLKRRAMFVQLRDADVANAELVEEKRLSRELSAQVQEFIQGEHLAERHQSGAQSCTIVRSDACPVSEAIHRETNLCPWTPDCSACTADMDPLYMADNAWRKSAS